MDLTEGPPQEARIRPLPQFEPVEKDLPVASMARKWTVPEHLEEDTEEANERPLNPSAFGPTMLLQRSRFPSVTQQRS